VSGERGGREGGEASRVDESRVLPREANETFVDRERVMSIVSA